MNGDQLQYEIDNAGVPLEQRSDYPLRSFDADDWAKAFCKQNPAIDVDTARAWFAGALMCGFDEHAKRHRSTVMQFIGWLSRDIPELHRVAVPRLAASWERFLRAKERAPTRSDCVVSGVSAAIARIDGQLIARYDDQERRALLQREPWWRRIFKRGTRS